MLKNIKLEGERIIIKNLEKNDYKDLEPLFNDKESLYYYLPGQVKTFKADELVTLMEDWNNKKSDFVFSVKKKNSATDLGETIAIITAEAVNFFQKQLEIGIAIISQENRGRGFATEALHLFIDYLFHDLTFHRINARVIEGNLDSLKLFQRLGFKIEGILRQFVKRNDKYLDMYQLGLLSQEW